jgi:hypothetical protein
VDNPIDEKRQYRRNCGQAMIEISHPSFGLLLLKGKDLSDGGAFALIGSHQLPPIGTVLAVRIKRHAGFINIEPTAMKVIHHERRGIGLMFV